MTPYATPIEATTYFANRLHTEPWDSLQDTQAAPEIVANLLAIPPVIGVPAVLFAYHPDKIKALNHATMILERLNIRGTKTSLVQELQFPRSPDTAIPADVKAACCELALALLDGVDPDLEFENLRMAQQIIGGAKTTYDRTTDVEHIAAGVPCVAAWRLIKPFMHDTNAVSITRV